MGGAVEEKTMDTISRDQFVTRLTDSWQLYVSRFQQLSPAEQAAFLQKQGYARFGDLLAHIIAWWQDGAAWIGKMQADPAVQLPDYNVDDFNASAVKRVEGMDEPAIIQAYQAQCSAMLDLVTHLPDEQLYQKNINTRLFYEIIGHWTEHLLEVPEAS